MRSLWICLITILNLFSYGFAQKIQNFNVNSNSPILQKEARVIGLKKIFTIDGNSDLYHLTDPYKFKIAKDESVFLIDWGKALYRFSSSGKYLSNLYIKGEGPGELKHLLSYYLVDNTVIQFCHYPNKIVIKDFNGVLQNEFSIPQKGVLILLGIKVDTYFFSKAYTRRLAYNKLSVKYQDIVMNDYYYSWNLGDKKTLKSNIHFKKIRRVKKIPGWGTVSSSSPKHAFAISNLKNSYQYFINSFDYKIKKINIRDLTIQ
ncbi:MAG: hypothetical protein ABFR75_14530, partial [Acidobacteriota bacterium]